MKDIRRAPWALFLPGICLSLSPALAAAEVNSPLAPERSEQTLTPWCAKVVCQRRAAFVDRSASQDQPSSEREAQPFAVRLGVGAAAFYAPPRYPFAPLEPTIDGLDSYGSLGPKLEGAALSVGISLDQPLGATAALHWGLEERWAFITVLPLDHGSSIGTMLDLIAFARIASVPLRLGMGPSLAVTHLYGQDSRVAASDLAVIANGAAVVRWDTNLLPITLDVTAHWGKALNYDGGTYRDLQLSVAYAL